MKASSIIHKNEKRIKVEFPNSKESTQLIKEITGAKWSATMKSWHIPYTKEAFAELKQRCPDIEIIPAIKPAQQNLDPQNTNNDPEVDHALLRSSGVSLAGKSPDCPVSAALPDALQDD